MKKTLAKILGITISLVLIMQSMTVFATTETQRLENEKEQNEKEIEEIRKKHEELEANKSAAMKTVEELIGKISTAEAEADDLKAKVDDLSSQIEVKQKDIQQKEQEYNDLEGMLDDRLISIYEGEKMTYLNVLLTASSMTDFLAKYNAASELIEYDKELMELTKEQKEQIESEKSQLDAQKKELDTARIQAEAKATELNSLKKSKQNEVNKLNEDEKKLQQEMEELEDANRKIQAKIKEAEEKYRKQLEELQKNNGNVPTGSGYFMRPVASGSITTYEYYKSSGKFHGGIDYGVPVGTTVVAAADGVVMTTANLSTSYGTHVVIRHANGMQTYYAHGTKGSICVSPGDTVKKGQKIMLSGSTGNSTGPHLHFEVRVAPYKYSSSAKGYGGDSRVNPLLYL